MKADDENPLDKNPFDKKPEPEPKKQVFDRIEVLKWPTLPTPWSSTDEGETWVWGDFFFTFQKEPIAVVDSLMKMQGNKSDPRGMTYPYSMLAFYRIDKSPHGQSLLPIAAVALERLDMNSFIPDIGRIMGGPFQSNPPMIGVFTAKKRLNLGIYQGSLKPEDVKTVFFKIFEHLLNLSDQPELIGTLQQAHGHPKTGLPARRKQSGFTLFIFAFALFSGCSLLLK